LECEALDNYIKLRGKGLRSALNSSYAVLVNAELMQLPSYELAVYPNELPSYLSRLILTLTEEKKSLSETFGMLGINHTINRQYFREKEEPVESADTIELQVTKDSPEMRYSHYLFQLCCSSLLESYEDLLKKLYTGQLGMLASATTKTVSINSSASRLFPSQLPVRTIAQALEEYSFFKVFHLYKPGLSIF
jgi:hypothetical protein